ncbi:MAG: imidazole glycerol phosphate synthase subunit HisH [Eubacterium sp.]|nr:imidazole glycerol phosphate synthase subunit HisH [Eubacterium sp.]
MIAIIDYDAGNIKSVEKALQFLGQEAVITSDRETIMNADKAILPGVGAFGDAMNKIRERGLEEVIHDFVDTGKPFLGICLGLQLIFEKSEESPEATGLGLLKGTITKIPTEVNGVNQKVPQIGWNNIVVNPDSKLLAGLGKNPYVYFVHSYYLKAENSDEVAATTEYGVKIDCAVEKGNVMATQFHPEKSSEVGLKILTNFVNL